MADILDFNAHRQQRQGEQDNARRYGEDDTLPWAQLITPEGLGMSIPLDLIDDIVHGQVDLDASIAEADIDPRVGMTALGYIARSIMADWLERQLEELRDEEE